MRLVRMRGLDITEIGFDFDLTWAAVIFSTDARVIGRYGIGGRNAEASVSVGGFRRALERALELAATLKATDEWPNRKKPRPSKYRRPEEIPHQQVAATRDPVKSCIHCHQVHEALFTDATMSPRLNVQDFVRLFPPPMALGLELAVDDDLVLTRSAGAAAAAGLRPGDRLIAADGVPLVSAADLVWESQQLAADARSLSMEVERDGKRIAVAIGLAEDWKRNDASWRASLYALPPKPGLWIEDASREKRRELGLDDDRLALVVRGLFAPAVRRSGLREGDVILEADGSRDRRDERVFHLELRLRHGQPGSILRLAVLRDGTEREVTVRFD